MDGAFTALLLVVCVVSSDAVQPPSTPTVSCQNQQTTVSWDYSDSQPNTIFRVTVIVSNFKRSFNTTDHQYDLSQFVWSSEDHYLGSLFVDVTAIQDGSESKAAKAKSFSFSQYQAVDLKCELNFPPVDVRVAETGSSVSFRNPLDFYNLRGTVRPGSAPKLTYTISLDGKSETEPGSCIKTDTSCKSDVKFSEDMEECVTLTGYLSFGSTHEVKFNKTEKFCYEPKTDGMVVLAVVLGSVFLVALIVAVVIIVEVKAWTMKTPTPSPHVLDVEGEGPHQRCSIFKDPVIDPVSTFEPYDGPSGHTGDAACSGYPPGSSSGCDGSPRGYEGRARLDGSDPHLEAAGLMSGTDEDSADGSQSTECVSISSVEEEGNAYERRQSVRMDMGDGDMVNGYTGN